MGCFWSCDDTIFYLRTCYISDFGLPNCHDHFQPLKTYCIGSQFYTKERHLRQSLRLCCPDTETMAGAPPLQMVLWLSQLSQSQHQVPLSEVPPPPGLPPNFASLLLPGSRADESRRKKLQVSYRNSLEHWRFQNSGNQRICCSPGKTLRV